MHMAWGRAMGTSRFFLCLSGGPCLVACDLGVDGCKSGQMEVRIASLLADSTS